MEHGEHEKTEKKMSSPDKPAIEPFAASRAMQRFIENRKIRPEDFSLLEELSRFPRDLIIECLHNHFNMNRERSEKELLNLLTHEKGVLSKELYEKILSFLKKYDYSVCYNLVRILEGEIE